jgi:hypothetical protein
MGNGRFYQFFYFDSGGICAGQMSEKAGESAFGIGKNGGKNLCQE